MCQCAQMAKNAQDVELGNRTGCLIPPLVSYQTPIGILAMWESNRVICKVKETKPWVKFQTLSL